MVSTINQRLKEYLEEKKIQAPAIYNKIGVSRVVWSNYINGGQPISLSKLQLIIGLLPNLNVRWLLTGDISNPEGEIVESQSGKCDGCIAKQKEIDLLNEQIHILTDHNNTLKQIAATQLLLIEDKQKIIYMHEKKK